MMLATRFVMLFTTIIISIISINLKKLQKFTKAEKSKEFASILRKNVRFKNLKYSKNNERGHYLF
jgi:hypothetical protein